MLFMLPSLRGEAVPTNTNCAKNLGCVQGGPCGCFTHPRVAEIGFVVDAFTPLQRGWLWALIQQL